MIHISASFASDASVPGDQADLELQLSVDTWAKICSGREMISSAIDEGSIGTTGERSRIDRFLSCFDHPGIRG